MCSTFFTENIGLKPCLAPPPGAYGQHGRPGRVLQAPHAAPATTLVSFLPTKAGQVGSYDPDTLPYSSPSLMVAPGGKRSNGFVLSPNPTVRHHHDRRFIDTAPTTGVRCMGKKFPITSTYWRCGQW